MSDKKNYIMDFENKFEHFNDENTLKLNKIKSTKITKSTYHYHLIYKVLKNWAIVVLICTIIYFSYWHYVYGVFPVSYYSRDRQTFLRNNTTALPPPLVNFMDPPSVFNKSYNQ